MGVFDKVGDLAKDNAGKIEEGIEKTGDFIDEKTGGKFSEKVDQAQDFAKDQLGKVTGEQA